MLVKQLRCSDKVATLNCNDGYDKNYALVSGVHPKNIKDVTDADTRSPSICPHSPGR